MADTKKIKLTVNMNRDVVDALADIANERGVSMTSALEQSVVNYCWLRKQQDEGSKILIEQPRLKEVSL